MAKARLSNLDLSRTYATSPCEASFILKPLILH
jgi:hypothetical protein